MPSGRDRRHFTRRPVLVHELLDGSLAVSYHGPLLARFTTDPELVTKGKRKAA